MTNIIRSRTARVLRGASAVKSRGASRLRQARIMVLYPSVTFTGTCFIAEGVRVIATRDSPITIDSCHIARNALIEAGAGASIHLAADFVGPGSVLVAQSSITVGKGSKIAEMVVIRDADHDHSRPLSELSFVAQPIVIGVDVWIGAGATILKGTDIGDHATVAAGAVVTRSVLPGRSVGGVPARFLSPES